MIPFWWKKPLWINNYLLNNQKSNFCLLNFSGTQTGLFVQPKLFELSMVHKANEEELKKESLKQKNAIMQSIF